MRGNIAVHKGTCRNHYIVSDGYATDYSGVNSYGDAVSDSWIPLSLPSILTPNRASFMQVNVHPKHRPGADRDSVRVSKVQPSPATNFGANLDTVAQGQVLSGDTEYEFSPAACLALKQIENVAVAVILQ